MKTRVNLKYFVNDCRLRGINKGSVNVDNYTDDVASIYLANVQKHIKTALLLDWS